MRHFVRQQCVRLALYVAVARFALACGADTDRGPPIGSPTGPSGPVINEAGSSTTTGQGGSPPNAGGSSAVGPVVTGGALSNGGDSFGIGGNNGTAGRDPFGIGGTGTSSDPFGFGGNSIPTPGFSGASSF